VALIPPKYLDAVVAIGIENCGNEPSFIGTSFLFGYPSDIDPGDGRYWFEVFLVTNRHVVEGRDNIVVRFNRPMGTPSQVISVDENNSAASWTMNPRGADVAVIPISMSALKGRGIECSVFQLKDNTLSRWEACEVQISEGDGVFVLGFPMGISGEERNYTIVRNGIIARIQDWLHEKADEFLIDANVFPGNSGGPVVTRPESVQISGTQSFMRCCLIGMVSSYLPYDDVAISQQTNKPRVIFQENSGLAVVVPLDTIQETVKFALNHSN